MIDRAAVELAAGDELISRLQKGVERQELRGVTRGHRQRRRPAFERGDARLQHGLRRIGDARIDVTERLQPEQSRGVIGIIEDVGGCLINRCNTRAG